MVIPIKATVSTTKAVVNRFNLLVDFSNRIDDSLSLFKRIFVLIISSLSEPDHCGGYPIMITINE